MPGVVRQSRNVGLPAHASDMYGELESVELTAILDDLLACTGYTHAFLRISAACPAEHWPACQSAVPERCLQF